MKNKIDIIKRLLYELEKENYLTELFKKSSGKSQREFKDFSPETIYLQLIKCIVDLDDIPPNIDAVNVHVDSNNQIIRYELLSSGSKTTSYRINVSIYWNE